MVGIEPTLCYHKQILSLSRLPVPPHEHIKAKYRQLSYTQAVFRLAGLITLASLCALALHLSAQAIKLVAFQPFQDATLNRPCWFCQYPHVSCRFRLSVGFEPTYLSSTQWLLDQLSYDSYSLSWFIMDFLFVYSLYVWTMLISQLSPKCWRRESNSYDVSTEGF